MKSSKPFRKSSKSAQQGACVEFNGEEFRDSKNKTLPTVKVSKKTAMELFKSLS